MNTVQQVLSQRVVGYNFTRDYAETVVASVCRMSDGTGQTVYAGHRLYHGDNDELIWDYGENCPNVERTQEAV